MAAEKFIQHDDVGNLKEVQTVSIGGAGSAEKIPSLDANGRFDATMMPTGVGGDTAVLEASGALAAGDFVNIFNDGGTAKMRKADASAIGTAAHGFVLVAVADGVTGTVYFEGSNTAVTGVTPGSTFLATTAGTASATPPTGSGEVVQRLGIALSATQINFEPATPILLA